MRSRQFVLGSTVVVGLAAFATLVLAQGQGQSYAVKKVQDNLYYVEGGGGNSSIIIGQNGVIVVDVKTTVEGGKQVVDAVSKLTNKPITTVILTHSDGDHVNGLPAFPRGVTIIAHQNDRKEMEQAIAAGARGAPPTEYLPNKIVIQERENDTIDGVKMTLIHVANAHTSGDLAVYLPDQKVVISGDLIGPGDPLIHLQKNGTSDGWIRFVSTLVKLDANTYVLGHADPETRAQVEANLKMVQDKREKIAALVKQGKSLDEVMQALGEVKKTGANAPRFPTYTETTYDELTKK